MFGFYKVSNNSLQCVESNWETQMIDKTTTNHEKMSDAVMDTAVFLMLKQMKKGSHTWKHRTKLVLLKKINNKLKVNG